MNCQLYVTCGEIHACKKFPDLQAADGAPKSRFGRNGISQQMAATESESNSKERENVSPTFAILGGWVAFTFTSNAMYH